MVCKSLGLGGFLLVAAVGGLEPRGMIGRLGSPSYAEREAASAALEKLGPSAFPALKAARNDHDPEVKNRASLIHDSIERSLLTRPSVVHLDAHRYTVHELADKLSACQGISIGVGDSADVALPARSSLDIRKPEDIEVWALMDRLGMTFQWDFEATNDFGRQPVRRAAAVKMVPRPAGEIRSSDDGPFQVVLNPPHSAAENPIPFDGQGRGRGMNYRAAMGDKSTVIPMEIQAEPRLSLHPTGTIRVTEATDDAGRSYSGSLRGELDLANLNSNDRAVSNGRVRLRFRAGEAEPRSLKRLRGTIPVAVEARRLEPILIPIPDQAHPEQRPVSFGGATVQVHGLTTRAFAPKGAYTLDLTARRDGWSFVAGGGRGRMGPFVGQGVVADTIWDNLEIVDATGKPFHVGSPRTLAAEGDGVHVQLEVTPRTEAGVPTDVRFFGSLRTTVEIPFDFHDVKLR